MVRTTLPRPARLALRLLAVSGVALATANCATTPQQKLAAGNGSGIDPKYGVKASPRLYNEGDVIPKGGGRRYTGKPYVVAGQTYVPKEDPRGYVREGLASWYGSAFHGRMTANGEVFDRHSIAAAHPTLPLPSYARVTNLDNGYSMVVRVNDRGPYHAGRVMDVSEEAAEALGFHRRGTARVRVEYAGKAAVAGSDDRKLLASLRTDGQPAGRSTVMMADLGASSGASDEPERYARPASEPLAFKPAPEREPPADAQAPRPERPAPVRAPVVLASAAMRVPAAVQPTAPRVRDFRPAPIQVAERTMADRKGGAAKGMESKGTGLLVAGLNPVSGHGAASATGHGAAPTRTAGAGPMKLAKAGPAALPAARPDRSALAHLASAAAPSKSPAQSATRVAARAAAPLPVSAKFAAPTKVAAAAKAPAPAKAGAVKTATKTAAPAGAGHARLAGIY